MSDNVSESFMWNKLEDFQRSISRIAEALFQEIDPELKPKVFLIGVGVLVNQRNDRHPIYLEPQNCGYTVNDFARLNELAKVLQEIDPDNKYMKKIIDTNCFLKLLSDNAFSYWWCVINLIAPIAQANKDQQIEAIQKMLSVSESDRFNNTEKYISSPEEVNGLLIFIVLELQKEVLSKHYSLVNKTAKYFPRLLIYRSFIESVVYSYLNEGSKALKAPSRGSNKINRKPHELIREAGEKFMYAVGFAGNNLGENFKVYDLYDACNMISSLKYEGEEGLGKMVIACQDHPNIKYTLQLQEPIKIQEFRKARKFLQLANKDSIIISDAVFIYGLGELRGQYNPRDESLFVINFISHLKWEILHNNQVMMIVEYNQPRLPKTLIDRDKFYSDLRRIFTGIEDTQLSDLWDIVMEATKQKHGTMLVITDKAEDESKRLGKQCFPIKPLRLDPSIIQQITSIDGSVLLDSHATCYAVGVILDGTATDKGDSSRGARYNSAIRYYEQHGKNSPTILVIISEDGMIDLIPSD